MGKSLVINGADFSENCIDSVGKWLWGMSENDITYLQSDNNVLYFVVYDSTCSNINQEEIHQPILKIKSYATDSGALSILAVNKSTNQYTVLASINVTPGFNVYNLETSIVVPNDCYIGFANDVSGALKSNVNISSAPDFGTVGIKGFSFAPLNNPSNIAQAYKGAMGIDLYVINN